jgi:hypothetical protein
VNRTRLGAAALAALFPLLSGCRSLAHTFERLEIEHRREVSREVLEERWTGRDRVDLVAEAGADGVLLSATAHDAGVLRARVTEEVRIEEGCARRAVAGIFEAPDSVWGVLADIWTGLAFLGVFLLMHVRTDHWEYVLAFLILGIAPIALDALFFIPWWIADHDWVGPCNHVAEIRELGEVTEEREERLSRTQALAPATVSVRQEGAAGERGRIALGADGKGRMTFRQIVEWSRGGSGDLVLEVSDGGFSASAKISPGRVLNGPSGSPADWTAGAAGAPPDLTVATRLEGSTLVVRVRNRGAGDAWQVAVLVAADHPDADGLAAALGHIRPQELVEARIALPQGVRRGALDFSEAHGRAPPAVPFGE